LPWGGIYAAAFIILIHLVIATLIVPYPVARWPLRRKILALTQQHRPAIIFAGDSRAQEHILPMITAEPLHLSDGDVINVGVTGADSPAVLAAFRELRDRFQPHPILVLSVSPWSSVGDTREIQDELLWTLGLVDRLRVAPTVAEALLATFLPERTCAERIADWFHRRGRIPHVPDFGFRGFEHDPTRLFAEAKMARAVAPLVSKPLFDYFDANDIRGRQLEADLRSLRRLGAQVVVIDAPKHPTFVETTRGTLKGRLHERFHRKLKELCTRLVIPLLQYDADDLGRREPEHLFFDYLHLNREGAAIYSELVGRDLNELIQRGELRLPPNCTGTVNDPNSRAPR
jgi:hypothetical protein